MLLYLTGLIALFHAADTRAKDLRLAGHFDGGSATPKCTPRAVAFVGDQVCMSAGWGESECVVVIPTIERACADDLHMEEMRTLSAPSPPGAQSNFGHSMAARDTWLAVGAPTAAHERLNSGAVYLFRVEPKQDDVPTPVPTMITPRSGGNGDWFGASVAFGSRWLVIGSPQPGNKDKAGYITVFRCDIRNDALGLDAGVELHPSEPQANEAFAQCVLVEGDLVVAAAPKHSGRAKHTGRVLVFRHDDQSNAWQQVQALVPPGPELGEGFGRAIALAGEWLIIGSARSCAGSFGSGAVFCFTNRQNEFQLVQQLAPPRCAPAAFFGERIQASDQCLVIAAPTLPFANRHSSGDVYVYTVDDTSKVAPFQLVASLSNEVIPAAPRFGDPLCLHGNAILAGQSYIGPQGSGASVRYLVYQRGF